MRCPVDHHEIGDVCRNEDCRYYESLLRGRKGNCALIVAEEGPHKLRELSKLLGLTRERVRQIEALGLRHLAWLSLREALDRHGLRRIVRLSFGNVDKWPPSRSRSTVSLNRLETIVLAYSLGVLFDFVDDQSQWDFAHCPILSKTVSTLVCAFCSDNMKCYTDDEIDQLKKHLRVSSFDELLKHIEEELGLGQEGESKRWAI